MALSIKLNTPGPHFTLTSNKNSVVLNTETLKQIPAAQDLFQKHDVNTKTGQKKNLLAEYEVMITWNGSELLVKSTGPQCTLVRSDHGMHKLWIENSLVILEFIVEVS